MGRHAHSTTSSRGFFAWVARGVAPWVWAVILIVIVLTAATIGWFVVVNQTDAGDQGLCAKRITVAVAAGPSSAPAISDAAHAYNATDTVVRSTCVTIAVTAVADDVALSGLTGAWPSGAGRAPALWIPDNAAASALLSDITPVVTAGRPSDPFAWSPTVLAAHRDDTAALDGLAWNSLPDAAGPDGEVTLPGGRHLILALPQLSQSPGTGYALQAIMAGPDRQQAVTEASVSSHADALTAVGDDAVDQDSTIRTELVSLSRDRSDATAVPVVEADFASFVTGRDHANEAPTDDLGVAYLSGPTVGASLIATPITNLRLADRTRAAGASSFQAFLGDAAGQQIMANHGWRTARGITADHSIPGINVDTPVEILPAAAPAVDVALARILGQIPPMLPPTPTSTPPTSPTTTSAPPSTTSTPPISTTSTSPTTSTTPTTTSSEPGATGPVVTLVVDSSSSMGEKVDDKALLTWMRTGLDAVIGDDITNRIGLWAFSDSGFLPPNGYPELVSTGALDGTVTDTDGDDVVRRNALTTALKGLKAKGDRWAYGALMEALKSAADSAIDGRASRIILVTSGVDETPGTPRQDVLDAIKNAPGDIRIDVIGLGDSVPVSAYSDIAQTGGGDYVPVTDPADVEQVVTNLLTIEN